MRIRQSLLAAAASSGLISAACNSFENLVAFGDSYSDNGRLNYYIAHQGKPPPPGTLSTQTNVTASGGLTWGQYVQQSAPGVAFFDYAVGGAVCSNEITPRYFSSINRTFPSVLEDEIPSFQEDTAGSHSLYQNRTADNTVYALWIGTNDIGFGAFLNDAQTAGTNITTYVDCVFSVLDSIYAAGGRRIVLFNLAPLQLVPTYRPQSAGGAGDHQYWGNKSLYNETEYANKILEYTVNINTIFDYGVPFHALVRRRWLGASVSIYNTHQLLTDIYNNPSEFLEAPANSTGYFHHCEPTNSHNCTDAAGVIENYMFYDELHPSPKTDSVIAEKFLDVVAGVSKYGTTYQS
ncbi:GDSL lipase/acylhydrolase family protein [Sporothrix brasiliensis 5110]|uniref:GDSL lipase/acylhydrolase family protein n=1 Tax=Sporothrix brasiliensis 5110 TaxID=1398154 RepID=A0A0C2JDB3_9PEZI|nr:GDSL lipase/acylhydrolase family protein [Sporothrix brasiliensis 5110]KIH94937.1 GDSL lipase/acylhydrolase family protein [Sporothrix brasiliensis 5110]